MHGFQVERFMTTLDDAEGPFEADFLSPSRSS